MTRTRALAFVAALVSAWWVCAPAMADKPAGLSPQTIKLPAGATGLKGLGESFEPNISTGTANFSVPLDTPPGRVQPSLALLYVAGSGRGPVGVSFELPILSIYRTTDKGSPDFDEDDRFAVSGPTLNDELVRVNEERGYYRLKNEGAFALFIRDRSGDAWTIRLASGETVELGSRQSSRESARGRTYRWYVDRQYDRFGHEAVYEYVRDLGRLYPSVISYQLDAPGYENRIVFGYETRPDVTTDYRYGEGISTAWRLRSVEMVHGPRTLRTYRLAYRNDQLFSLLTRVDMDGEGGRASMPPLTFEYVERSSRSGGLIDMQQLPPLEGLVDGGAVLEDINADGLPDLLVGEAGDYHYYENVDGRSFAAAAVGIANSPDRSLFEPDTLLADMNGDGFRDVVHAQGDHIRFYPGGDIRRGEMLGFAPAQDVQVIGGAIDYGRQDVRISDLDSDGRIDLLHQKPGRDSRFLNLPGNVLLEESVAELPADVSFDDPRLRMEDFNGDGVLDFVLLALGTDSSRVRVWHGLGRGEYAPEVDMVGVPRGDPSEFHLLDINRDQQADLLRVSGSWLTYYLNDGSGRFTSAQADLQGLPSTAQTAALLFADMNGNGTTDVVWITQDDRLRYLDLIAEPNFGLLARIDNGMGFVVDNAYRSSTELAIESKKAGRRWLHPMPFPMPVLTETAASNSMDQLGYAAMDARTTFEYSDGYYDGTEREFRGFARVVQTSWGDELHPTEVTETLLHVGRDADGNDEEALKGRAYLVSVRDEHGALYSTTETRWQARWLCQEDLSSPEDVLPRCNRFQDRAASKDSLVAHAVAAETLTGAWDGTAEPSYVGTESEFDAWGQQVRDVRHGEVRPQADYVPGEGFVFRDVAVGADEEVWETEYIHRADPSDWILGLPTRQRLRVLDGTLVSQSVRYYDGPDFVGLPEGQARAGLLSRLSSWVSYPGEAARWVDTQRYAYDVDGQVRTTLDANGNATRLEYDPQTRQFPIAEIAEAEREDGQPLDIVFGARYDTGLGTVVESIDPDGNSTHYGYDALGRLETVFDALSSAGCPRVRYAYAYGDPVSSTVTSRLVRFDPARCGDVFTGTLPHDLYRTAHDYYDGQGRSLMRKVEAEAGAPGGYVASGYRVFSTRGAEVMGFDSFFSDTLGFEAAPASVQARTTYRDVLGRPLEIHAPDTERLRGVYTRYVYAGFRTDVYDERDSAEGLGGRFPATSIVDGRGNAREVIKHNVVDGSAVELRWSFDYDAAGNIVGLTDPGGARRTYDYDSAGRLRALYDPNLGAVAYEYDDAFNLVRRTDGVGHEQQWVFGAANRLLEQHNRHAAGQGTTPPDYSYYFHYDAPDPGGPLPGATNLTGQLAWVEFPTGSEHYSNDLRARPIEEARVLWNPLTGGQDVFRQQLAYDNSDLIGVELAAPGWTGGPRGPVGAASASLRMQYNQRGLVERFVADVGSGPREVVRGVRYDHRGADVDMTLGNGVRSCRAFDERGQLVALLVGDADDVDCRDAGDSQAGYLHQGYDRGFDGQIERIRDLSAGAPSPLVASYAYDRLYQLTEAHTRLGTHRFSYDHVQNLVRREVSVGDSTTVSDRAYGERGAGPNAVTTVDGASLAYDGAGRLTSYRGFALSYDAEGRLAGGSHADGRSVRYYYDAFGERRIVVRHVPGQTDQVFRYPFPQYQERDGVPVWMLEASAAVEVARAPGIPIDSYLYAELSQYVQRLEAGLPPGPKPLPEEYLDLDGDGDGFDRGDLDVAAQGWASGALVGGPRELWRYHHEDHAGSTTLVTDSAGAPVGEQVFAPYGELADQRGLSPLLGFVGQEIEAELDLGLVRMGSRYYAPDLGRWITPDGYIGESPNRAVDALLSLNLYSYAANNPVGNLDPNGTQEFAAAGCAIGAVAGAGVGCAPGAAIGGAIDLAKWALIGAGVIAVGTGIVLFSDETVRTAPEVRIDIGPSPAPTPDPETEPEPKPKPKERPRPPPLPRSDEDDDDDDTPRRVWVTYTNKHPKTGKVYSGRTSGTMRKGETAEQAAKRAIRKRWSAHHMRGQGYLPQNARLDRVTVQEGPALDRTSEAYAAIRGREQFLVDFYGGARSDLRNNTAGSSGNPSRPIKLRNKAKLKRYIDAARARGFDLPDRHPGGPLPQPP